jgi:hypothetical protein
MTWDESKHPRDEAGRFANKQLTPLERVISSPEAQVTIANLRARNPDRYPLEPVKIDLDTDVQQQMRKATKVERIKIAKAYLNDKFKGVHTMSDGRVINATDRGIKEFLYKPSKAHELKLKISPQLAEILQSSTFDREVPIDKKRKDDFDRFAYYNTKFDINGAMYTAVVNIAIDTKAGRAIFIDVNQLNEV